ncbi:MAG: hypothetical protein LUM44_08725 [Pyrinomonadaceae bacterium]|nr:hypothetical protein [Pyrinomonadaceae bacterium]
MQLPKFIFHKTVLGLLIFALAVTVFAQKTTRVNSASGTFKQLAGPADEIYTMRLPEPSETGLRSKSAMIAVKSGGQRIEIPVETADDFRVMILSQESRNWDVKAILPNGESLNPRLESVAVDRVETTYGLGSEQFPAEVFAFKNISAGILRLEINTPKTSLKSDETVGYLVASSNSPYRLYSYVNTLQTVKNRNVGFVSSLFDGNAKAETALSGTIARSEIELRAPSGRIVKAEMFDDGNHGDRIAGDGVFGGGFVPTESGKYTAQVTTRGTTPNGEEFIRTAEHVFEVAEARAELGGNAFVRQLDDARYQIILPAEGVRAGQKVIAHAEVWGRDERGNEQAIAWVGGIVLAERSFGGRSSATLPLTLDARWLVRSNANNNYELRNVRVQDVNSSVVLGTADAVRLPEIKVSENLRTDYFGEITDEMRTGKRPEIVTNDAVGGKLMLVHGYCSGDAWGAAASAGQFTNYVKFLDLNQNRSHDQFANLIRNFGASLPSFGIVAHSQGGAASLHLYTYYWSGLDSATGGTRLIQSVGTPYQGTALAGNLAILGQIFGAGCGSNTDLTYSGAASWLAGIPTWARQKVYYHTTSFTDVWYRYDYCNLATDPFLSDPEDGVVERAYAQLPGANNLGHKTGWCHTSGMRDPSQTTDSSRNSNMNANAAR